MANQAVCPGLPFVGVTFGGGPAGTVYNWTNSNPLIGLGASGTGGFAGFFAINTDSLPAVATITVTPTLNGCAGTPITFTLTVYGQPKIGIVASGPTALLPGKTVTLTTKVSPAGGTFAWQKNGLAIAGATTGSLGPLGLNDFGTYTCTYTLPTGCLATSADMVISGQPSDKVFIYPSPNNGQFKVSYYNAGGTSTQRRIIIYDMLGQIMYDQPFDITGPYTILNIDMKRAGAGIYMVEVDDANRNKLAVGKVEIR